MLVCSAATSTTGAEGRGTSTGAGAGVAGAMTGGRCSPGLVAGGLAGEGGTSSAPGSVDGDGDGVGDAAPPAAGRAGLAVGAGTRIVTGGFDAGCGPGAVEPLPLGVAAGGGAAEGDGVVTGASSPGTVSFETEAGGRTPSAMLVSGRGMTSDRHCHAPQRTTTRSAAIPICTRRSRVRSRSR